MAERAPPGGRESSMLNASSKRSVACRVRVRDRFRDRVKVG